MSSQLTVDVAKLQAASQHLHRWVWKHQSVCLILNVWGLLVNWPLGCAGSFLRIFDVSQITKFKRQTLQHLSACLSSGMPCLLSFCWPQSLPGSTTPRRSCAGILLRPTSACFNSLLLIRVNTTAYEVEQGWQFSLLLLLSTCLDTEALINVSGWLKDKSKRDTRITSDSNNLDHYGLSSFFLCDRSTACLTVVFHSSVMSRLSLISVNTLMSTVLLLQMSLTAQNYTNLSQVVIHWNYPLLVLLVTGNTV